MNKAYEMKPPLVDTYIHQQLVQFILQGVLSWYQYCWQAYGINREDADALREDIINDQYLRSDKGRSDYYDLKRAHQASCNYRNRSRY